MPETPGRGASFEDLLADPDFQTPLDTAILPYLLRFGPPAAIEVRHCRCAAVHAGRCDKTAPAREKA